MLQSNALPCFVGLGQSEIFSFLFFLFSAVASGCHTTLHCNICFTQDPANTTNFNLKPMVSPDSAEAP